MSYINSLKLFLKFDNTSLYEEVSGTFMRANKTSTSPSEDLGDASATVLSNGQGYIMKDDQYLLGKGISNGGYFLNISTAFTLGFWLNPVNPGLATNITTGNSESITMPLIDWVNSSSGENILRITENTLDNNENYLKIYMNEEGYIASTENYEANLWHQVWIAYNGTSLYIFIDGKLQTLSNISGSVPVSIFASYIDLYINHSLNGYSSSTAKNYGYIDDIFIMNEIDINDEDIKKTINYGTSYLVDSSLNTKNIDGYSIYFNDPSMITINSIISDMGYVFIGRNDGKILRGSPLLWETRRVFSDKNEVPLLDINENDIENGFLKINNKIIEL